MLNSLPDQLKLINKNKVYLWIFLFIWLLINLLQSAFTELAHDEAYYWMYSRHLDWGYFDHPPVIALLIKAGYSLFQNEFGVRLFTCILGTLTMGILFSTIDSQYRPVSLFIFLTCSVSLVQSHVGGFLAIPDIPMIFFAALFLYVYKIYLHKDKYWLAIILAVVAALMIYSKYQGVLLLLFSFLANLKLVRRRSFWIIPVLITLFLLPHLFWQIQNGFPSFKYHLISRSSAYTFKHTLNFLYSQFLIAGPLVSVIVFHAALSYKSNNIFERTLKYNLIGVLIFFFLSSFRGHVEAHWTAIAYIPLVILSYQKIVKSEKSSLWIKRLFIPSIAVFILIRIFLVVDILPKSISTAREMHEWDKWASQIDSLADGRKVVFVNSFQRPAKYSFYTKGKFSHSLNNIYYRKNQYDIWPFEDEVQHQKVLLMQSSNAEDTLISIVGEKYAYELINDFSSYHNIKLDPDKRRIDASLGDTVYLDVKIINPGHLDLNFKAGDEITATYHTGRKFLKHKKIASLKSICLPAGESIKLTVPVYIPGKKGKYALYISIATGNQLPAMNGPKIKVLVK